MNPRPILFSFRNPNFEIRISNSPPAFRHATSTPFIFLTPSPLKPLIPRRPPAGFSLTEVVIALGIFAVSMIGVLALFPVASSAGRESSEETQAAILAETVLGDVRSSTSAKGKSAGWIVRGPNTFTNVQWIKPINLTVRSNYFILYDLISRTNSSGPNGVGMIGNPIALKAMTTVVNESTYSNAVNSAGAIYGSQVAIEPVSTLTGLAAVTVTVNSPVSVTSTNRRSYSFSTLIFAP